MGRIGRSLELVKQSHRILMQDKELMVLPLISGVVIAVAVTVEPAVPVPMALTAETRKS